MSAYINADEYPPRSPEPEAGFVAGTDPQDAARARPPQRSLPTSYSREGGPAYNCLLLPVAAELSERAVGIFI